MPTVGVQVMPSANSWNVGRRATPVRSPHSILSPLVSQRIRTDIGDTHPNQINNSQHITFPIISTGFFSISTRSTVKPQDLRPDALRAQGRVSHAGCFLTMPSRRGCLGIRYNPKGPSTQYLGTCDLGNSNYSTGFGEVYMVICCPSLQIQIATVGTRPQSSSTEPPGALGTYHMAT